MDTPLHHLDGQVGARREQGVGQVLLHHRQHHQGLEGHPPSLWVLVGQLQEVRSIQILPNIQGFFVNTNFSVLKVQLLKFLCFFVNLIQLFVEVLFSKNSFELVLITVLEK